MSFPCLPIVDLAFATLGHGFSELDVLGAFAVTFTVVAVVVGGEVRVTLPGMVAVLSFARLVLVVAISNLGVKVAAFVTLFPPGALVCCCCAVAAGPDAAVVALVSKPLSSDESSP